MTQMLIVPIKVISEAVKFQRLGFTGHLGPKNSGDLCSIILGIPHDYLLTMTIIVL